MEDLDLGEIPNIGLPANIEVPISHDIPKTTLDSLLQIRTEFSQKLEDSNVKNDSSKKRRYQRQLKQFEDAIKATKEGKTFNYSELTVPPGFARIPLQNDGRPILSTQSNRTSTVPSASNRTSINPSNVNQVRPQEPKEAYDNIHENDEASDDILDQLDREMEENGFEDEDEPVDSDEEHINKQINSLLPKISKMLPKEPEIDDDVDEQIEALKIPKRSSNQPNQQKQIDRQSHSNAKLPTLSPPQPQPQPQPQSQSPKKRNQVQNKDLTILLERQRLFKEAALEAKKEGNVSIALVYLRNAKGFDSMISAAENGLPLDMNNLPIPPQLETKRSSHIGQALARTSPAKTNHPLAVETNDEPITGDRNAVFKRLQEDLRAQIKIATDNFKHFTSMGDVSNANKFNQIARESIQDLESLKNALTHGESVPLYHYEKRSYQTIDCNSDLTDNDLELCIVRAINLPLPKDFDAKHLTTYVKFEFPYPPESVQSDKTSKQSGTLNPEYNQSFKLQIQRKQTKFARLMNRKELKLEIFYKAGLLKSDKLLATCLVKLQCLEKSSTIHDAFDLFEGRRQIGGKLEVKLRIREPLLHKDVKVLEQKWLIIDKFSIQSSSSAF